MNIENLKTIEAIRNFIDGTEHVVFTVIDDKLERYKWIQKVLISIRYRSLSKHEKGIVIKFICKVIIIDTIIWKF